MTQDNKSTIAPKILKKNLKNVYKLSPVKTASFLYSVLINHWRHSLIHSDLSEQNTCTNYTNMRPKKPDRPYFPTLTLNIFIGKSAENEVRKFYSIHILFCLLSIQTNMATCESGFHARSSVLSLTFKECTH